MQGVITPKAMAVEGEQSGGFPPQTGWEICNLLVSFFSVVVVVVVVGAVSPLDTALLQLHPRFFFGGELLGFFVWDMFCSVAVK